MIGRWKHIQIVSSLANIDVLLDDNNLVVSFHYMKDPFTLGLSTCGYMKGPTM